LKYLVKTMRIKKLKLYYIIYHIYNINKMQCNVNANQLRPGVRYTIKHINETIFREDFVRYELENGIDNKTVVFKNVEIMQGTLHMPVNFIYDIKIYVLPNKSNQFPYLIPVELNEIINNYI